MKMGDLKIGTRLNIGFPMVILLTLAVGAAALHQMRVLASHTNDMYDHPLTVGYTMRDIRSEIDVMHDLMQRLPFTRDPVELDEMERKIGDMELTFRTPEHAKWDN